MSIRTKILVLVLGAVLLMGIVGTLVGRTVATNALEDEAQAHLIDVAAAKFAQIQTMLKDRTDAMEALSLQAVTLSQVVSLADDSQTTGSDDYKMLNSLLTMTAATSRHITDAIYFSPAGEVMASSLMSSLTLDPRMADLEAIDWSMIDPTLMTQYPIDWSAIDLTGTDWEGIDFNQIDFASIDLTLVNWENLGPVVMQLFEQISHLMQERIDRIDWSRIMSRGSEGSWAEIVQVNDQVEPDLRLAVAIPISNVSGLQGIMVFLGIDEELGRGIINATGLGDTGEVYLVDEAGYMRVSSKFMDEAIPMQQVILPEVGAGEIESIKSTNYLGSEVIGVYQKIPNTPWTLVVEKGEKEVFSAVDDLTRNMLWAMALALGLVATLALLIARAISRPIVRLKEGVERIIEGDWDYDVSTTATDEIGDFSRAFGAMTADLHKSQTELKRYSRELEAKVAQLEQTDAALRESEERYRHLADNATDIIWTMDMNLAMTYVSPSVLKIRGFTPEEAMAQPMEERILPEFLQYVAEIYQQELEYELSFRPDEIRTVTFEVKQYCKDGSAIWTQSHTTWIRGDDGQPVGIIGVTHDVTERKQAQEKVLSSLAEKEVLLKEIHHRVKNNLQIISSLLNLQKHGITDETMQEMFDDSGRRVRSMSLIHEQLYSSDNLAQIDFAQYVRGLCTNLLHSYNIGSESVGLNVEGSDIFMGIDMAVPCGLMINEIITNSMKYAFPAHWLLGNVDGRKPRIDVILKRDHDRLIFEVSDNGIGLPEQVNFRKTETLGLQLVSSLADQLEATVEIDRANGTTFRITIMESESKSE